MTIGRVLVATIAVHIASFIVLAVGPDEGVVTLLVCTNAESFVLTALAVTANVMIPGALFLCALALAFKGGTYPKYMSKLMTALYAGGVAVFFICLVGYINQSHRYTCDPL